MISIVFFYYLLLKNKHSHNTSISSTIKNKCTFFIKFQTRILQITQPKNLFSENVKFHISYDLNILYILIQYVYIQV
jgi:hypothetical protein